MHRAAAVRGPHGRGARQALGRRAGWARGGRGVGAALGKPEAISGHDCRCGKMKKSPQPTRLTGLLSHSNALRCFVRFDVFGASDRNRTGTTCLRSADFKSAVSTNFTTEAREVSLGLWPIRPASLAARCNQRMPKRKSPKMPRAAAGKARWYCGLEATCPPSAAAAAQPQRGLKSAARAMAIKSV